MEGAQYLAGHGHVQIVLDAGNAEIHDLDPTVLQDHEVGGLNVAVDDVAFVRVLQAVADLDDVVELVHHRQRTLLADHDVKALAFEELHHQEGRAVTIPQVVDDDDVLVLQAAGGFRFAMEALQELGSSA